MNHDLEDAKEQTGLSRMQSRKQPISRAEPEEAPKPKAGKSRAPRPPFLIGWRKELWDWFKALVVAVVIVLLLREFVFQLSTVRSHSMEPTLYENEWLFINKISLKLEPLKRGDVVILKDPREGAERKEFLVKRIVAVAGDTLEVRGGELYINGELTVEPYTNSAIEDGDYGPEQVGEGYYFLMGDNRQAQMSIDSRSFGTVPESLIQGRADFIVWPITKWDSL